MKLCDVFEALARVPAKPEMRDPDYVFDENYMGSVQDVVSAILGDRLGDADSDDLKETDVIVVKSWTGYDIFSSMDSDPGMGGVIGLVNPRGKSAKEIATAAHESFHALLQTRGKNYENEHVVNRLAARWLQDHFEGPFLHAALEAIIQSKISYKTTKYTPTREWLKAHSLR